MNPSGLFRRAKDRFSRATPIEKSIWICGIAVSSPVTLPIFVGFWASRRRQKHDLSLLHGPKRRFVTSTARPAALPVDPDLEAELRAEEDSFALVRILGNDLPPRHKIGQSRENLDFILRNEPEFDACEKLWIVNRIIDPDEEARIVERLEAEGQRYEVIPFEASEYAQVPLDFSISEDSQPLQSDRFQAMSAEQQVRLIAQVHRLKNAYAMHNNGARNRAIEIGRARAKWVLPFDGNCFLTDADWRHLRSGIAAIPDRQYVVVPMARLGTNDAAFDPLDPRQAREEPQLAFRRDASERFDEAHPYGRRPKVELMARLGVEGPWSGWIMDPWDIPAGPVGPASHRVGKAGLVRRLASGRSDLESGDREAIRSRGIARAGAIVATLSRADRLVLEARGFRTDRTLFFDPAAVSACGGAPEEPISRALANAANEAKARGPYSVTRKGELPPGGDPHDYYHPAPYWWPDPASPDGLPYIRRDGQRRPGTEMYGAESDRFDRTRFHLMCDDTIACALAWTAFGDAAAREHALTLLRTWFLDPDTAMNPHLRYAQVRRGRDGEEGNPAGIIELKDLAVLLDAVRLVGDADLINRLSAWFRSYSGWLLSSGQGQMERRARNNHGLYFDIQIAAIAAFLGDTEMLLESYMQSFSRLGGHFDAAGSQPHELSRTLTQHYCAFNLQGWLTLLRLYGRCEFPLDSQPEMGRVADGVRWFLGYRGKDWPYPQVAPFDTERFTPIAICAADLGFEAEITEDDRQLLGQRPQFHPHDGIPSFWPLSLTGFPSVGRPREVVR